MLSTHFIWGLFDNIFLLRMGQTYQARFRNFIEVAEDLEAVAQWRQEQQEEWDRLSPAVCLAYKHHSTNYLNQTFAYSARTSRRYERRYTRHHPPST
jgi:hypothetical protein